MLKNEAKTKIIATIGPASNSPKVIEQLIKKGVDVFRLNFSHGSHSEHQKTINLIRFASKKIDQPVAILADLQGPKIRTGKTENNQSIPLKKNQDVTITMDNTICTDKVISIDYKKLSDEIDVGASILINDGSIKLIVQKIDKTKKEIQCKVLSSGKYSSRKGVNLPNVNLSVPALTSKDRKDLNFIIDQDINYIALSFVREAKDLSPLNNIIKKKKLSTKVIAKIEKPEAIENFMEILENCNGIMVARGDLGVETSVYEVPALQKELIEVANQQGKQVIVATQMLESMISSEVPTRAEASDVANAIFDNSDAVMLSGETAVGINPVNAVDTMNLIAVESESSPLCNNDFITLDLKNRSITHSICEAAEWASRDNGGMPVIVFTTSGDTALYLSKIRNQSPIFAFTPDKNITNALAMAWNTRSFLLEEKKLFIDMVSSAENTLLKKKLIRKGQPLVIISGDGPFKGSTNNLRIKFAGEE